MERRLSLALVVLFATLCCAFGYLDRDAIRKSVLQYRSKRSLNDQEFSPRLRRVRRQAEFPVDDEDGDGSGEEDDVVETEILPDTAVSGLDSSPVSEWVWYRTKLNFLDSIVYTDELTNYHTEAFHSLSEKIMIGVEDYLADALPGYQEATPLMFTQTPTGQVFVLVDVGACTLNSAESVEQAMRSLLQSGQISDFAVSDKEFSMREVGRDRTRVECQSPGKQGFTSTSSTTTTTATTTTSTSSRFGFEPTPPDEFDTEGTSRNCNPETQATCRNGQCIDRRSVCDGNRDCADGSDEPPGCGDSAVCDPTEILCPATGICVQKMWKCDGDDDCGDGYDELNCPTAAPGSRCRGIEFECVRESLCVPASYQCDGENDCSDASDEDGCVRPTVIIPPKRNVTIVEGETAVLECEAIGIPTPLISWRLNWGNVGRPPRVSMTSSGGRGELIIKEARRSDQGAYTCEAINSQGSIFAVPDAILTVEDSGVIPEQPTCPPGQYGMEEENCRPCYCFGVSNECVPLQMEYDEIGIEFNSPDDVGFIELRPAESEGANPTPASEPINRNQILVKPAARELQLIDLSKRFLAAAHYWSLPAQFLGAKINSYGGTLTFSFSYNNSYNFDPKPTNYSDVIIEGANGRTLIYHGKEDHPEPEIKHNRKVGLNEAGWTTAEGESATREDMLGVLNNIDKLLLRTVYDDSMLSTGIGDVRMSVAQEGEHKTGEMAYEVEKCICPDGYEGLSCQDCAPGYERISAGPFLGRCELIIDEREPCPDGYAGDDCEECAPGYEKVSGMHGDECSQIGSYRCDSSGAVGPATNGRCECRDNVQGAACNQCKPGYFYLSESNVAGCIACFCMGITSDCESSNWLRRKIVPSYSDGDRFHLINAGSTRRLQNNVRFQESVGRITARADLRGQPRDVFYWVMPSVFTGDMIASYGGDLRYTIDYSGGSRHILSPDVKISGNGITLQYPISPEAVPAGISSSNVKMTEDNWQHVNGTPATRKDFLLALADLDSFLIRASYATEMIETSIYDLSLETADDTSTSARRAVEVEMCACPPGYQGSSCEDCVAGYHRSTEGPYLGTCVKCSCNGHSDSCDGVTGECVECQHNTVGAQCERCKDGFYGDPRFGTPNDCRPCPCPALPSRSDLPRTATCILDIDDLPTCDECPPGYEGRYCDVCSDGYKADELRECRKVGTSCECDPNGSVDGTCDEEGVCNCKESVGGPRCDSCKPSYFYFSVENTGGGCLPCFCMGVTTQCHSSRYSRDSVEADFGNNYGGFSLTNRLQTRHITNDFETRSRNTVLARITSRLPNDLYYWDLPSAFLGDKVVSYGGDLKYNVSFTPLSSGIPISQPDVILIGNDVTLVATLDEVVESEKSVQRTVTFRESFWARADGQPATREHLLMALADVESLLIRASYSSSMAETTIGEVSMETARAEDFGQLDFAYEVEECTCPDGYKGLSCEDCAPGYTRFSGGFYLGLCSPCQCNGRADTCDSETGVCSDCRENTVGQHCESCAPGYFSMSSDPSSLSCSPCECPTSQNSFSKTCEYVPETRSLFCNACEEGYEGARCESCAEGYEGNPRAPGGRCVSRRTRDIPPRVTVTPTSLRAKDGSQATLKCEVNSDYPDFTVTWRKLGSTTRLPPSVVLGIDGATLTIPRFSRREVGTYECTAEDEGGRGRANAVLSWAPKGEKISVRVEEPSSRRLPAGDEVTFVCTAESETMGYIVHWSKRHGRLPRSRSTEFNGILHIKNLTEEDSGTYICTGSNMFDVDTKEAQLVVVRDTDEEMPVITIEPERQVVREGEEARFRCSANGTEPIRIEWRPSAGESLPENARIINGELYLPAVSTSDSAVFYCRAHNSQGFVESTAVLDVTAVGTSPIVTVVTSTVVHTVEGENVEMRCTATGLPLPLFSWRRVGRARLPDNAQPRGGTLLIMSAKRSDADTYVCTARNDFGEDSGAILLNVSSKGVVEKPICKTDPEFLTAYVGADTSVTCVPQGDPLPTVTWVRGDGMPLPSNARIDGNRLVLNDVTLKNAGNYICIATNPGGTTRSQMTLKVEDKSLPDVQILPRNQQVVEIGKSTNFTCKPIAGHPVEVTWTRTDRKPFTERTTLKGGVITFSNVTEEDGGSYLCIARNVVGFREVASLLSVIKKPTITVEPTADVYLRKGSSIRMRCTADGIPVPNVAWEKIRMFGRGVALTHYKRLSNVLTIRADDVSKNSQYACVARSAAGDTRQKVTVTVGDRETVIPPEVTVEKRIVSAGLGRRVQLRCAASGYPAPEVRWKKVGGTLPNGSHQENGVLTIESAREDTAGTYACEAINTGGDDSSESALKIIIPPTLTINPPGPIIRLPAGQSQLITCSASQGTDPVTYQFNKVTGGLSDNVLTSGDRLQILSFDPNSDSGAYTCVGRNQAGSGTAEVTLLELELPTAAISSEEVKVAVGDSFELQCTSTNAGDEITWRKVGSELDDERTSSSAGVLRVQNARNTDAGEYECHASNKAGLSDATARVVVLEIPTVTMTLSPEEEIRLGERFEISCLASGIPSPTITITKDGVEILSVEDGRLIVESATNSNAGTYRCLARNDVGSDTGELVVNIQEPLMLSVIPDMAVMDTRSGEELAISCVVKGTDLPVTWTRERGELPSSATVIGSVLQIDKVNYEDSGKYICAADANGKSLRKEIQINVQAFIPYFTQSPTSYLSLIGNEDFYRDLSITVSFRPNAADGLLLYSYGSGGDFISLALVKGKVEFRYNVGSGDAVILSNTAVEMSKWHTATISRAGREGILLVDKEDPVYGTSEGSFETLDLDQPLYVGGYPTSGDGLPEALQFLGLDVGFYGCISQLIIGSQTIDLEASDLIVDKTGILRCKTCGTEDEGSPCQHGSTCTESYSGYKGYICGCSEEYVGPECQFRAEDICGDFGVCGQHSLCVPDYERELGYRCECILGYTGPKCQNKEIERVIEEPPSDLPLELPLETTQSDNELDGVFNEDNAIPDASSFSKGSYLQLAVEHNDPTQFDVTMRVKLRSLDDSLILYNGGALNKRKRTLSPSDIFASIAVLNRSLEFRYNFGTGMTIVASSAEVLEDGEWHKIRVNRYNRRGLLEVDGDVVAQGQSPEGEQSSDLTGPLYLGGIKFWDRIPQQVGVTAGLDGCIEEVSVDGRHMTMGAVMGSKNVERCDVVTTTTTTTTQPATTTTVAPSSDDDDFSPIFISSGIPAGFSGSAAKFHGDSFISFPQDTFPHDTVAEQISLHFRSRDTTGLILLHGRSGGDFLLLGLKNAHLEYVFRLGAHQHKLVSRFPVSDGRWHNITVVRRGPLALMWIDELQLPVTRHAQIDSTRHLELGDLFIGGTADVPMSTGDRYRRGFRGCLKDIRITALDRTDIQTFGSSFYDDSRTSRLMFGSNQGRKAVKGIGRCRPDKTRGNRFK